jgi:hypothetical protein
MPSDKPENTFLMTLETLRNQRNRINQAIDALEHVLRASGVAIPPDTGVPPGPAPGTSVLFPGTESAPAGTIPAHMLNGKALPEAAKLILLIRNRPMTSEEITAEMVAAGVPFAAKDPANSVNFALVRAKKSNEIIRENGQWRMASWSKESVKGRNINEAAANMRAGLMLARQRGVKLGRKSKLSPEQCAVIARTVEERPEGASRMSVIEQLAKEYGVHSQTIKNACKTAKPAKAQATPSPTTGAIDIDTAVADSILKH